MNLHYSQTQLIPIGLQISFTTLWIYTTLKRAEVCAFFARGFTTLWIYTTLKPLPFKNNSERGFTTLWIYTTLKQIKRYVYDTCGFTTLWIYTTLKLTTLWVRGKQVLLPYEFTLLSNQIYS